MKNFGRRNNDKSGVTLIILVITIIIMIILASVITVNTKESIDSSKLVSFAEEISTLEDSAKSYHLLNGNLPKIDDSIEYTAQKVLDLKTKDSAERYDLRDEIIFNKDEDSKFYKLDLKKVDVDKISRGKANKDPQDIFLISYPNLNVYYLKGIKVNRVYYYTLTNKITEMNVLESNRNDSSTTDVTTTSSIKVSKEKMYTTNLKVKINVNMKTGEKLYMSVCSEPSSSSNKLINTVVGGNSFSFNKISELLTPESNIKFTNPLTEADVKKIEGTLKDGVYTAEGRESNRYIYLSKYDDKNTLIDKVKIDLNNYANIGPKVLSNNIDELDNINIYNLDLEKGDAPIKEVRYDYIKKIDKYIGIVNYYEGKDDIDFKYILENGKKSNIINNKCSIKTDNNIAKIKVVILDEAGNYVISEMGVNSKTTLTTNGNLSANVSAIMRPRLYGMNPVKVVGNTLEITNENDKDWYKYIRQTGDNGESHWANAVTQDGSSYFVWIPRYAYKLTNGSPAGTIDVIFIDLNDKTVEGKNIPEGYIVHPAFNLPDEKLPGIWVGKYESSNNNDKIEIKPGVPSCRTINVSTIFDTCYNMQNNFSYGFKGLKEGSTHMLKNTEWGAAAYLAHSNYGRNGVEVTINNNQNYITGIAGDTVSAEQTTSVENSWNTEKGVYASTTKNITGIYDMSGGAWEYVAGNYNWEPLTAGNKQKFDELYGSKSTKYFDVYTGTTGIDGDATTETENWHGDYDVFVDSSIPWFLRGGTFVNGSRAGLFSQHKHFGNDYNNGGFRLCIFG